MHLFCVIPITSSRHISGYIEFEYIDIGRRIKEMLKKSKISLFALILLTFFGTLPAYGLVIAGPSLNQAEKGWGDFGC